MVFSQLLAKSNLVFQGDNLEILPHFPEGSVDLIYIDPPYNTGKVQTRRTLKTTQTKPTSPVELGGDAESGDSRLGGDAELGGGRLDGDAEQGTSAGSRKGFGAGPITPKKSAKLPTMTNSKTILPSSSPA